MGFRSFIIAGVLFLAGCIANADAKPPLNVESAINYARVGGTRYGHEHVAPTAGTIAGFVGDDADFVSDAIGDIRLIEWGTLLTISCVTNAATFCFVMDTDETTMTTAGVVTDTDATTGLGTDGAGACFRVEPGAYRDVTIFRDSFRTASSVGRRISYCNTGNATHAEWPCDADADCGAGGACVLTATNNNMQPFEKIRGAFLLSRAGTASTCFITEEK